MLRLLVDDEPFDLRYGELLAHDRVLDFRAGVLTRAVRWRSPARRAVRVTSTRLVSFTQRAILAIAYEVEPIDGRANIVVQSELVANEAMRRRRRSAHRRRDRVAARRRGASRGATRRGLLIHRTRRSGLRIAAAMDHVISGTPALRLVTQASPDSARVVATDVLEPGQRLRIVKFVAYGWSGERTLPALRDQVAAALLAAAPAGWERLVAEQRELPRRVLGDRRRRARGRLELQQAVRFALFQRALGRRARGGAGIPAKGLTGTGYDGHSFWDTEIYRRAGAGVHRARCRGRRAALAPLDAARGQARARRPRPRRRRVSLAHHPRRGVLGLLAGRNRRLSRQRRHRRTPVILYVRATGDERVRARRRPRDPRRDGAAVALARPLRLAAATSASTASPAPTNTPPSSTTTSTRTSWRSGTSPAPPTPASAIGTGRARSASRPTRWPRWRAAAERVVIPYDERARRPSAVGGIHRARAVGLRGDEARPVPALALHFPYFDLYRRQVVKQPDLVLAMQLFSDAFTPEQRARNFDYYERITVRDSSLSACTRRSPPPTPATCRLAFDYAAEAALMDLHDLRAQHARRPAHRVAGRNLDRASSWASAACATTASR